MKMESEVGHRMTSSTLNVDAFRDYLETQLKRLPPLPDVEQISPRVIRVLGQNPGEFTLQGTNTYIVGTGRSRLIIDTGQGSPQWIENVVSLLESMGIILSHVLLTHWHGDHTGGVADLIKSYPHLTTAIYKNSPARDQNNIIDGQSFSVEGATVRALHTPGHAHDHMCFVLVEENAMFTGDNILGHGTTAVEELGPIMSSWRRMLTENCERGYPGHGQLIQNLNHKITEQLASKVRRENLVLDALRRIRGQQGPQMAGRRMSINPKQLVMLVHGKGINENVSTLVLEPFLIETLRKLAADGIVGFEICNGEKRWFPVQTV